MSKEETEQGRVEVLPVQWRKHLTLEVTVCSSVCQKLLSQLIIEAVVLELLSWSKCASAPGRSQSAAGAKATADPFN